MPILQSFPLTETIPFAAGLQRFVKLPRDRFIRQIQMRLLLEIVNSASVPVNQEDNPMGIIRRARIIANGNDNRFEVPMALRFYELAYLAGTPPERVQTSLTASATSTGIAEITSDFAMDDLNLQDVSALLPAADLTDLELQVDWGVVGEVQITNPGTITVANSFVRVTVIEAELTQEDLDALRASFGEEKILKKVVKVAVFTRAAVSTNYTNSANVPVGALVQRHIIQALDGATPIRSDTVVSQFRFRQNSPVRKDIEERRWTESQAADKRKYHLETVIRGITTVDWTDKGMLNLSDLKEGDLKYQENNAAPVGTSNTTLLQTEYE